MSTTLEGAQIPEPGTQKIAQPQTRAVLPDPFQMPSDNARYGDVKDLPLSKEDGAAGSGTDARFEAYQAFVNEAVRASFEFLRPKREEVSTFFIPIIANTDVTNQACPFEIGTITIENNDTTAVLHVAVGEGFGGATVDIPPGFAKVIPMRNDAHNWRLTVSGSVAGGKIAVVILQSDIKTYAIYKLS